MLYFDKLMIYTLQNWGWHHKLTAPSKNVYISYKEDLMFCKNKHEQEKRSFYINQCLHIKSSVGKFLLQYFPLVSNGFNQLGYFKGHLFTLFIF